ncbi:diguanylate cyclase [Bacillus inaquosorum]|uniref:diguanylate cyclase domain-containing protein n=1 Tax=Bacillus inaquosorum TaxID=483913 RepID=UPI00227DBDB6|nr:diguanylate cyclase [Bacillus inaquosorum]MCY8373690.1 diguanylate cyclase [Bacillus inaquosorum]MCY9081468.1 diguanylate cyclase [Bacillus inaquosorum]MEC0556140.1 diguanylate cyclase [Bacillus inaquosorum]
MVEQTKDQLSAFHYHMLDFLLTKSEKVTFTDSFIWLTSAIQTYFSSLCISLTPSPSDSVANVADDEVRFSAYKINASFYKIEDVSGRRFHLTCRQDGEIPEGLPDVVASFLNQSKKQERLYIKTIYQKKIYKMTELFHSLLDQTEVLKQLLESLTRTFSLFKFSLFISHDQDQCLGVPAKELYMEGEKSDSFALKVYLTGDILRKNESAAYIPIKGQQGTYGVLMAEGTGGSFITDAYLDEMSLIANAAGKAFENAQLYEQSKASIANLELINETSRRLNQRLTLTDTMNDLAVRMAESFQAEEVGFFHIDHFENLTLLPGSTAFFKEAKPSDFYHELKEKLYEGEKGVFIGNGQSVFGKAGYGSLMAVPMIENDRLLGFAVLLKQEMYAFTFEMYKLFQALIHHATLAVTNSMLRDRLEHLVKTDQLTELYSRVYLDEKIQYSMKIHQKGVFILVDIDNFKNVNDTYGHQTGDEILIQVASVIKSNIRKHDVGARWGGEELAIYLPNVTVAVGKRITERLVYAVRKNTKPEVTISCGISCWTAETRKSLKELVHEADEALYSAKRNGKNRLMVHESIK